MTIHFYKYQAGGSDSIILDNRDGRFTTLSREEAFMFCDRHYGIGGNGLVLLNKSEEADFSMKYFRFDGKEEGFSGNAAHNVVAFLKDQGQGEITGEVSFTAEDGAHEARFLEDGQIDLKMADVEKIEYEYQSAVVYISGVPNCIRYAQYLGDVDVFGEGRKLNKQKGFRKDGINLSYIEYGSDAVEVRTYERGIEEEVISCGVAAVSCALIIVGHENKQYEVPVAMMGGNYKVRFEKIGQQNFKNIWLTGSARKVMEGDFELDETWKDKLEMDELFRKEK